MTASIGALVSSLSVTARVTPRLGRAVQAVRLEQPREPTPPELAPSRGQVVLGPAAGPVHPQHGESGQLPVDVRHQAGVVVGERRVPEPLRPVRQRSSRRSSPPPGCPGTSRGRARTPAPGRRGRRTAPGVRRRDLLRVRRCAGRPTTCCWRWSRRTRAWWRSAAAPARPATSRGPCGGRWPGRCSSARAARLDPIPRPWWSGSTTTSSMPTSGSVWNHSRITSAQPASSPADVDGQLQLDGPRRRVADHEPHPLGGDDPVRVRPGPHRGRQPGMSTPWPRGPGGSSGMPGTLAPWRVPVVRVLRSSRPVDRGRTGRRRHAAGSRPARAVPGVRGSWWGSHPGAGSDA